MSDLDLVKAQEPVRVQLSRKKGWRMPPNTVKVSRPTAGGNPFRVGGWFRRGGTVGRYSCTYIQSMNPDANYTLIKDAAEAVEWFEWYVTTWTPAMRVEKLKGLEGKNLACWCKLDQPCHADVLLKLANPVAALPQAA